jgi:hypothetical protein
VQRVISAGSQARLKQEVVECIVDDRALLDQLRAEVQPLRDEVHRIQPRTTTAISLMGADGGNNSIPFDPFLVQLIRVVDSNNNEHCLEAITPTTSVTALSARQFDASGAPTTQLGKLMDYLGVRDITTLTHMIRRNEGDRPVSPSWVNVYRELVEWAILFVIIREYFFATDTILVFDGLLRSKVFAGDNFRRYLEGMEQGIQSHKSQRNRNVYLAGVAKRSKVLDRYRLAMALEGILATDYPAYVEVPRELEERLTSGPNTRGETTARTRAARSTSSSAARCSLSSSVADRGIQFGRWTSSYRSGTTRRRFSGTCWAMP